MITRAVRQIARLTLTEAWLGLLAKVEIQRLVLSNGPQPPLIAKQLLVSGEDHRSAHHGGFDMLAILRALWRRLFLGRIEGASTIEQQLVRVLTNRFERTWSRKWREVLLASLLAEALPKTEIAGLYLSAGYYGWRMNEFRSACLRLGLSPLSLSPSQAAELIARLKYPEPRVMSPRRRAQIARRGAHLLNLHKVHRSNGTYEHLSAPGAGEAVQSGSVSTGASAAASAA